MWDFLRWLNLISFRSELMKNAGSERDDDNFNKVKSNNIPNNKPQKKKRHNFLYVMIMGGLLFLGVSIIYMQYSYTIQLNKENENILSQIDKQNKLTEKIKNEKDYQNSDEYVEKIAREQLSLVKPDEILFFDLNK